MTSAAVRAARSAPGIALTFVILGLLSFGFIEAQGFRDVSRWFPQYVSIAGLVFGAAVLLWEFGIVRVGARESAEGDGRARDDEASTPAWRGFLNQLAWLVLLIASYLSLGAVIGTVAWSLAFLRLRAKRSWLVSAVFAVGAVVGVFLIAAFLNLVMPSGFLIPSGDWIPNWRIRL